MSQVNIDIGPYSIIGLYIVLSVLAMMWVWNKLLVFRDEIKPEYDYKSQGQLGDQKEELPLTWVLELGISSTVAICILTYFLGPLGAFISLGLASLLTVILYSHLIYLLQRSGVDRFRELLLRVYNGDEEFIYIAVGVLSYPLVIGLIILSGLAIRP